MFIIHKQIVAICFGQVVLLHSVIFLLYVCTQDPVNFRSLPLIARQLHLNYLQVTGCFGFSWMITVCLNSSGLFSFQIFSCQLMFGLVKEKFFFVYTLGFRLKMPLPLIFLQIAQSQRLRCIKQFEAI